MKLKRNIQVAIPFTGEEEAAQIREVVLSGNFVSGKKVEQFEKEFAAFTGTRGAAAVNSGTAALHTALALIGVGPGDEVIVPPLTFMSTITAVLHQKGVPVFADIDVDSFCLSPEDFKRKITSKTKAVIPVHLYGNMAEMDAIMRIANEHGIVVIEDCAQAHGSEYKGRRAGSIGHMGAFSFFATKHMTTGEGGILTSDNSEWIQKAKVIRSHGMVNRDDHVALGYNYRMNEMAAAMGLVQLGKLNDLNNLRIKNSLYLIEKLSKVKKNWFSLPILNKEIKHTFFWCPLILNQESGYKTEQVVSKLKEEGIEVRQRYRMPLYHQKVLKEFSLDYQNLFLSNAEKYAGNVIGLPNHPGLKNDDLDYIVNTVLNLF